MKCSDYEKCKPHSKVIKTGFVGRGQGDSQEHLMMKEILRNGALAGAIRVPKLMKNYKQGIMGKDGLS